MKMKKIIKFFLVVIVLFGIIKVFGKPGNQKQSEETTTVTTTAETTSTTTPKPEQETKEETPKNDSKEEKVSEARTKYQQIVLGDPMYGGEGGTSFEDVKAILGEPDSVSQNSYGDTQSIFATWHDSSLKGMASFTVSFMNNLATGKGYSGFSFVNHNEKVTLDEFNAIVTDGSFSYDQAIAQFGQPDSESESLFYGSYSNIVTWYNANGSFGANFDITFKDGYATGKGQYGMK